MSFMEETKVKMEKVIERFNQELSLIRTGRANPTILEGINIDYYGSPTPINQLAQISVVEGTQLLIKPFDVSSLKEMERAINLSNLSLPVQNDGNCLRINLPKLTEERRKELVKEVQRLAEETKVAIRNVRRDANEEIKKISDMPEDLQRDNREKVQKLTDDFIKTIDEITKNKSNEISTI